MNGSGGRKNEFMVYICVFEAGEATNSGKEQEVLSSTNKPQCIYWKRVVERSAIFLEVTTPNMREQRREIERRIEGWFNGCVFPGMLHSNSGFVGGLGLYFCRSSELIK